MDFRSDTVTRPTAEMRQAMAAAQVGDDVLGDDPTVLELQERTADLLGKEAALFVPSGSMSNLIGVRVHCRPGDEMLCEAGCHLFHYEQSGYAQICGVAARTIEGEYGVLRPEQFEGMVRPGDAHYARTRLVTLENTHNRGGGRVQPYECVEAITAWARAQGLRTHLDGARLWNAVAATAIPLRQWAQHFDTVSVCFSKGLGAPVGSALAGPHELIAEALRHRKVLGGAMRQAGIVAAGALHALEHHRERLADDHDNARRLADGVRHIEGVALVPDTVETNMLFFRIEPSLGTAAALRDRLKENGLLVLATGPQTLRMVTHLDVNAADVERAVAVLAEVVAGLAQRI